MADHPLGDPRMLAVAALGAALLGLVLGPGQRLERGPGRRAKLAYFAAGLLLAATLLALLADLRTFGLGWLLLMPLVAQARILLSAGGAAAVAALCLALLAGHAAVLGGPRAAIEVTLGIGTGVLFVLLFTDFALRESRARQESERLRAELERAHRRLARFAVQAEELAAERERTRFAREIHDSLGHYLTVVNVQLEAAALVLAERPDEARQRIGRGRDLIREGLAEVRRSVAALRASPLDGRTLPEALEGLAAEAAASGRLAVSLQVEGPVEALDGETALTLYRAAPEGLTNVRKHSGAARARLTLAADGGRVRLAVADDGAGCPAGLPEGRGLGLVGLRERVALLGGELRVRSSPGQGLSLEVEVPG
jgi:signal transduction histidine kinase